MTKMSAATLLILGAIILVASQEFNISYWLKSPSQRLQLQIDKDWQLISANKSTPIELKDLREIRFSSDSSQAKDWVKQIKLHVGIHEAANGHYYLETFVTQWIDGHDYGAVVQYDLVNSQTKNTIWEISRTYKIGFIY